MSSSESTLIAEKEYLEKLKYGLNKAQELAHIGHWELDLLSGNLFWSDEVYRIFGLEPQETREEYDFSGTPIRFWFFDKHKPLSEVAKK